LLKNAAQQDRKFTWLRRFLSVYNHFRAGAEMIMIGSEKL